MNALRNMSGQSFLIHRTGGAVVHLFPGRAITLTDEELKSSQVQRLIAGGLAGIQKIATPAPAANSSPAETEKQGMEKYELKKAAKQP